MRFGIFQRGLYEITWKEGHSSRVHLEQGDVIEAERVIITFDEAETWSKNTKDFSREEVAASLRNRDKALVALCADKLAERGHHHAANSLRKMLREGEIL